MNLRRDCSLEFSKLVQLTGLCESSLCAPGESRTHNLNLRKVVLYPVELRAPFDYAQGKLNFRAVSLRPRLQLYPKPMGEFLPREGKKKVLF